MKRITSFLPMVVLFAFIIGKAGAQPLSWQWATSAGGSMQEVIHTSCNDKNGNFYVAGEYRCPEMSFGNATLQSGINYSYNPWGFSHFIVKLNSNGEVMWAESGENMVFTGIATDRDGNLYATGFFQYSTTIGGYTFQVDSFTESVGSMFVKFDPQGNVLWAQEMDSLFLKSLATDAKGDVVAVGGFAGWKFPSVGIHTGLGMIVVIDCYIAKYNPKGNLLWSRRTDISNKMNKAYIETDQDDNIYVTGSFGSPMFIIEGDTLHNENSEPYGTITNIFVARYGTDGNLWWAKSTEEADNADVRDLAVNSKGEAYITGMFQGRSLIFDGKNNKGNAACQNSFLLQLSASGHVLFGEGNGNTSNNSSDCLVIDTADNVYVGGSFANTMTIGSTMLRSAGASDFYVVKHDTSGNVVFAISAGGTYFEDLYGIGIDEAGNFYAAGVFSSESFRLGDFVINRSSVLSSDIFVAKQGIPLATNVAALTPAIEFKTYPNPANDVLTVQSNAMQTAQFRLYNSQGKQVYEREVSRGINTIDVSGYSPGIYFYNIRAGGDYTHTGKLIR